MILKNNNKKNLINDEKLKRKRWKTFSLTVTLVLIVSIIFASIMIPINLYNKGIIGDYEASIQYKEVMNQDEEKYYVYLYTNDSDYCDKLKPTILQYQRSDLQKTNCKLYTYNVKDDIKKLVDGTENVQNVTSISDLRIVEVPILLLIFNLEGGNQIVSYVKGNEAITKQLNVILNYTLE